EIRVSLVHRLPHRGVKFVGFRFLKLREARDSEDRFAVARVATRRLPVPSDRKDAGPIRSKTARGPDRFTLSGGGKGSNLGGIGRVDGDDPTVITVIVAAVTGEAAIRDVNDAVDERQRAALVLKLGVEREATGLQVADVDGKACAWRAVGDRERVHFLALDRVGPDGRGHVNRPGFLVDNRRAENADRIEEAGPAGLAFHARGRPESFTPEGCSGRLVERSHHVVRADCDEGALSARTVLDVKRRGEHAALERGAEVRFEHHLRCSGLGQRWLDPMTLARRTAVALEHARARRGCTSTAAARATATATADGCA